MFLIFSSGDQLTKISSVVSQIDFVLMLWLEYDAWLDTDIIND